MLWPLLDVDPNSVRAGWLPLGLVVLLGVCIVALYFSMRHELKKVDVPWRRDLEAAEGGAEVEAVRDDPAEAHVIDAGTAPVAAGSRDSSASPAGGKPGKRRSR